MPMKRDSNKTKDGDSKKDESDLKRAASRSATTQSRSQSIDDSGVPSQDRDGLGHLLKGGMQPPQPIPSLLPTDNDGRRKDGDKCPRSGTRKEDKTSGSNSSGGNPSGNVTSAKQDRSTAKASGEISSKSNAVSQCGGRPVDLDGDRSSSPTKGGKKLEESTQTTSSQGHFSYSEPHRPNIVDLSNLRQFRESGATNNGEDPEEFYEANDSEGGHNSHTSSVEFPQTHGKINIEEEIAAAKAAKLVAKGEEADNSDYEQIDHEEADLKLAIELDQKLNNESVRDGALNVPHGTQKDMPGQFTVDRSEIQRTQVDQQSQPSRGWFASQSDRATEKLEQKIKSLRRKLEESQLTTLHYQKVVRQEQLNHTKTWNAAKAFDMELTSARRQIHHMEEEMRGLKFELAAVKQQLNDAVNLSEVRGKELKGAQVFLTKADTLSTTDVIQKVQALNEEVFQASALLGEMLQYEPPDPAIDRQACIAESRDKAAWMLGDYLTSILAQESLKPQQGPVNSLLIQIVMQIALTQWCAFVGSSWKPGDTSPAEILKSIYAEIRETEDQAVAGRWRSLTRSHVRYRTEEWTNNIMLGVLAVMQIAGWATRDDEQLQQLEKRLPSIFKALQDLRKAVGEDVTSTDLEIAVIEPNTQFDPDYMEDAYADGRASKGKKGPPERVLSTSGLGLKRIVIKRSSKGPIQMLAEILAFPKVVLERTIKEAMEPPPPQKLKRKKPAGEGGQDNQNVGPGSVSKWIGFG